MVGEYRSKYEMKWQVSRELYAKRLAMRRRWWITQRSGTALAADLAFARAQIKVGCLAHDSEDDTEVVHQVPREANKRSRASVASEVTERFKAGDLDECDLACQGSGVRRRPAAGKGRPTCWCRFETMECSTAWQHCIKHYCDYSAESAVQMYSAV